MALIEVAAEVAAGALRLIARLCVEVIFEFMLQGSGRWILGTLAPRARHSDLLCAVVGFVFWLAIILLLLWVSDALP